MKSFCVLIFVGLFAFFSQGVLAEDKNESKPKSMEESKVSAAVMLNESTLKMDKQIGVMREAHQKMSRIKTPEERKALLAEQIKIMHEAVAMLGTMPMPPPMEKPVAMGDMKGMKNMNDDMKEMKGMKYDEMKHEMKCDMEGGMAACHKHMEKRMEMMETLMQLMIDRMDAMAAS